MSESVVVTRDNFAIAVVAASHEKVVLVDFFATWCGPCQLLKPILQRLLKEYDFVLATVDIDQNPELANEYGVEGVPDVRIFTEGKMIPGFVGVLEEHKIREILENLYVKSDLDKLLVQFKDLQATRNLPEAKTVLDQLFQAYPQHPKVAIAAAEFLISLDKIPEALRLLNTIPPEQSEYFAIADTLRGGLYLKDITEIEVNSELDQRYVKAAELALGENYEEALTVLLEIVARDRRYRDDGARKAMLVIFNMLGKQDPITEKFQQQLMMTLY